MQPNSIHTQRPKNERAAPSTHSMRAAPTPPMLLVMGGRRRGDSRVDDFPNTADCASLPKAAEMCVLDRTLGMSSRSFLNDSSNHQQHPHPVCSPWLTPSFSCCVSPVSPIPLDPFSTVSCMIKGLPLLQNDKLMFGCRVLWDWEIWDTTVKSQRSSVRI